MLEEIWKILVFNKNLELAHILDLEGDFKSFHIANNNLLVNQSEKGLLYLENDQLVAWENGDFFKEMLVVGFISLTKNQHLVFTRNEGIFNLSPSKTEPWRANIPENIQINTVHQLKNGNIAIGSQRNGLFVLNPEGEILLEMNKDNGLRNNSILSLFEDVSGKL